MVDDYSDGSEAFRLRQEVRERFGNDVDDGQPDREQIFNGEVCSPSASEGGYGVFGSFEMVGHAPKPTNDRCGTFRKVVGCSRVELHDKVVFDKRKGLVNYSGKGYFRPVFHSCDNPRCPVCYERGWAVREAGNIDFRLEAISKRLDHVAFGDVEHIIVALPPESYGLSYDGLRRLCDKALMNRGVVGGVKIFHGARFNDEKRAWFWSPHFHVLGFIRHGYRQCRGCNRSKCVRGCGGFVDRSYRMHEVDDCIVKVKDKRKTVFGTAWYQLHHSTVRNDVKRFHVATWFGICSYRKMKIPKELRVEYNQRHRKKCPICGSDLVRHEYCGRDLSILAWFRKRRGVRESVDGVFDKASLWCEVVDRGSGSYAE